MRVIVLGGNGLIGSKVVVDAQSEGYEVVAASPSSGVNTITGEGLAKVLEGDAVVVDVTNSPSFEDAAVLEFFETSTRHILDEAAIAGVGHLV
ncbi:MAG: NAD-dependent epimerase/dehydratase family protein, partial [Acidimicrobiales bacterium]